MILNETIMSVALPRLMVDLDISARTVQWLTTAFMLTMAVVIPTTGFLLQRVSTRTVFLLAMGLVLSWDLARGALAGFWLLLLARIVQASGTAMIPLLMTTVLTLVPVERRGGDGKYHHCDLCRAGHWSDAFRAGSAVPVLAFHVRSGIAGCADFPDLRLAPAGEHRSCGSSETRSALGPAFDPAFGGVVYGLSQLGRGASGPEVALGFIAVGLAHADLRMAAAPACPGGRSPLLDLRAFSFPMFSLSLALLCLAMLALFGMVILLPIYLQTVRGIGSHNRTHAVARRPLDGPGRTNRRQDRRSAAGRGW